MRDFSKVSPRLWESERFRELESDADRLAYLYLLSNTHQNSIGCYRLPPPYACADLCWDPPKYEASEQALVEGGLISVDDHSREILILRWFKHNPPTNPKHYQGAVRQVKKIQSDTLREVASAELQTAWAARHADNQSLGARDVVSQALLDVTMAPFGSPL